MAKKKQKKEKEKFEYSNEVIGVLLVLLAIIGMLGYGVAGNFVRSFSDFLDGVAYFPLLIAFLCLGLYLIVKRKTPTFVSRMSLGFYLIIMAVLTLIHMEYVKKFTGTDLIVETFQNVMLAFKSADMIRHCGGGMIGSVLMYVFNWAFGDGVIIVIITLIILGLVFVFNTSIVGMFSKVRLPKKKDGKDKVVKEEQLQIKIPSEEEIIEDKRIVISSIEELTMKKDDIKSDVKEEVDRDIPIKKVDDKPLEPKEEVIINNGEYKLPSLNMLKTVKNVNSRENEQNAKDSIKKLEEVLKVFEISGKIVQVNIGPTVTQY